MFQFRLAVAASLLVFLGLTVASAADCAGDRKMVKYRSKVGTTVWGLTDGSVAKFSRMSVDPDGYPRPYHQDNYAGS